MARVYVSIGSNIDRDENIRGGVTELKKYFGELELSRVYESESVGFDGDNFFNLVAAFDTDEDVLTVAKILHNIENDHGRTREGPRFSSRTLDIDMLLYDDAVMKQGKLELPRDEITKNAFVRVHEFYKSPLVDTWGDWKDSKGGVDQPVNGDQSPRRARPRPHPRSCLPLKIQASRGLLWLNLSSCLGFA